MFSKVRFNAIWPVQHSLKLTFVQVAALVKKGSERTCGSAVVDAGRPGAFIGAPGPLLPFARLAIAAAQLHQTGHSSNVQHFRMVKVGSADFAAVLRLEIKDYLSVHLSKLCEGG